MLPDAAGCVRKGAILVLLALASCGGRSGWWTSEPPAGPAKAPERKDHIPRSQEKLGPGVHEAIQREGSAQVVVSLVEPASMRTRPIDAEAVRRDIAYLQDQLLEDVAASAFRVTHRFVNVPALAGSATAEGLALLSAHPHVVRIDLDVGGSASPGAGGRR